MLLLFGITNVTSVTSQTLVKKNILIEEFTSATCKPCKTAGPILAKIVQPLKDVYSVRYHIKFPPADDPIFLQNPIGIGDRATYYKVSSGIPKVQINGIVSANPAIESRVNDSVNTQRDKMTPVSLSVLQEPDGDSIKVTVKVRTSQVLPTNSKLYIAINCRRTYLPKLPFTLFGSNEKDEFEDAFMEMLPNGGIPLNLVVNVEQTIIRNYKPKVNEYWPFDMTYPVAFVQNIDSKEVFQSATDYKETKTEITGDNNKYFKVNPNGSVSRTFSVKNPNEDPLDVRIVLDTAGTPMPIGWNFSSNPEIQTIGSGSVKDFNVTIQSTNDTAYFKRIKVFAYGISNKIDIPSSEYFYILSTNAKNCLYTIGEQSLDTILLNDLSSTSKYHKETISMPFVDSLLTNYPAKDFEISIFALHGGTILKQTSRSGIPLASLSDKTDNFINTIVDIYNNNKKVFLIAPRATWWALSEDVAAADGKVTLVRNFLMNTIGISLKESLARSTNNFPDTFSVTGVTNSIYFSDVSSRLNTSPSSFTSFSDILTLNPGSKSVPLLYSDFNKTNLVGVGMTDNASKIFMFTVSPDAWVLNRNDRKLFVNRAMDWLNGFEPSPNTVLGISNVTELNLGEVLTTTPRNFEISLKTTPTATIKLTAIKNTNSAFVYDNTFLSSLPAEISSPTFSLKGLFSPTKEQDYKDTVSLYSDALNSVFTIIVTGKGKVNTSVQENIVVSKSKVLQIQKRIFEISSEELLKLVEVFDINGQKVFQTELSGLHQRIELPQALISGTYFLNITFENSTKQNHKILLVQ